MRWLLSVFSFQGRIGRIGYALAVAAIFVAQYLFAAVCATALGRAVSLDVWFWLFPLRTLVSLSTAPASLLAVAMVATLVADTLLAALSFRRAADGHVTIPIAILAVMPVVQFIAILALLVTPSRPAAPTSDDAQPSDERRDLAAAAMGGLIGGGVCAAATALSTLGFGVYGYSLFIVTPIVIGALAGYVANRRVELSVSATIGVVLAALLIAGFALIGLAFEGAICILMAAPLIVPMAIVGGLLGRVQAGRGRPSAQAAVFSLAILPALFAFERAITSEVNFTTTESVVIAAPPTAVWRALIDPAPMRERPSLPFRLGLAYPVSGQILGEGVGAARRGVFSTGVAQERVTVWRPNQALTFAVLADPPMMREMNPNPHVNAPHLMGYFHTASASFTLTPLPGGRTQLVVSAPNTMRIEPALYWLPLARWATEQDERRVLRHLRDVAEAMAQQ
jgi:hypothetical protein